MRSAMMPSSRISGSGVMMPIISGAATYITKPMNAMTTMPSDTVMRAKRCVSIRRPAPLLCPTNVVAASAIP